MIVVEVEVEVVTAGLRDCNDRASSEPCLET